MVLGFFEVFVVFLNFFGTCLGGVWRKASDVLGSRSFGISQATLKDQFYRHDAKYHIDVITFTPLWSLHCLLSHLLFSHTNVMGIVFLLLATTLVVITST